MLSLARKRCWSAHARLSRRWRENSMRLAIGADHAGYPLKEEVRGYLERLGHEVIDLGAFN
ncbi:MAG: RpiB/LacA/LacB family sugar-phosphate isomerase, partial [Acidobacteriaceae bacterium]